MFLLDGNEDEEIMKELEVIALEDPMIDRAMKDWETASADPRQRELYFNRKKAVLDELAAVAASELNAEMAEARGEAKGKILMAQDAICQYLKVHFGSDSQALQETVRAITDLNALSQIMNRIFIVNHLDEANALIQDSLISQ